MTVPFTLRYSHIGPGELFILRICAALESKYPEVAEAQGNRRASVILVGYAEWKKRMASRDLTQAASGAVSTNTQNNQ